MAAEVAQQKKANISTMKRSLEAESVQKQFENALGENKGLFIASLIDLYSSNDKLQECPPNAVIYEALKAAVLKLPINKSLGFAWIVPYKKVPVFQIGYKGYIQLAMRSGQYRTINTDVVYEGEYKGKDKVSGTIDISGEKKSDKVVGYLAHFELLNGFQKTLYSTVDQIVAHAKRFSPSYNWKDSAWQTDFDAMAQKTLIRKLIGTWGVMSIDMQQAFVNDSDDPGKDSRDEEFSAKAGSKAFDISGMQKTGAEQSKGADKKEDEKKAEGEAEGETTDQSEGTNEGPGF